MNEDYNESPFNSVPPVIVAIALLIFGIEVAFQLGASGYIGGRSAVGWRNNAATDYALNGQILNMMLEQGRWSMDFTIRLVSYLFIHGSMIHAIFGAVMVLTLGKMVGEIYSTFATLVVFFVSGIVGALAWGWILDDTRWLFGAFPAVYGLIGAFTYIMWVRLGEVGAPQRRAFSLIGFLLGIQLVFNLFPGADSTDWVADLAGFFTGFLMSFVVSPGGWARLREQMRRN